MPSSSGKQLNRFMPFEVRLRTRLRSYLKATAIVDVIPLRAITPPLFPLREDLGDIDELVNSIRRRGLLEPILVRPIKTKFEIVAGHRRYTACKLNGLSEIPAIIRDMSDRDAFEVSIEENLHRKTLDPIEEARAFKLYVDKFGYGSSTELAGRIGKSEEFVSHRIALLSLPERIQEMVRRRLLTSSDAWEIYRVSDSSKQQSLAETAVQNDLTVRQLRHAANLLNQGVPAKEALNGIQRREPDFDSMANLSKPRSRMRKGASTLLRVALIRLDNLIDEVDHGDRGLRQELFNLRLSLHLLIDRFLQGAYEDDTVTHEVTAFLRNQYLEASNTKNVSGISTTREPKVFTMFDDFPPLHLMDSREAEKHCARVFDDAKASNCSMEQLRVVSLGELALATFTYCYHIEFETFSYNGNSRVSVVLQRTSTSWQILHEHWSRIEQENADRMVSLEMHSHL